MPEEMYVLLPSGAVQIDFKLSSFTKYFQSPITPWSLTFTTSPDTPIFRTAEIMFYVDGSQVYHGLVTSIEEKDLYKKIETKSMEWLLAWRYIPDFYYRNGTVTCNLNSILSSDEPPNGSYGSANNTHAGILYLLQSIIPNGKWTAHSSTVKKLAGAGSASCFGSRNLYAMTSFPHAGSVDACDGIRKLTAASAIPTANNTFYRTNDDLYVGFGSGLYAPNAFLVCASYWADCKIRRGTIELGAYKPTSTMSLPGVASSQINDLVELLAQEIEFVPNNDGYLYMGMKTNVGRGSESSPIGITWVDGQNCTIERIDQKEPDYQAALSYDSSDLNSLTSVAMDAVNRIGAKIFKILDRSGLAKEDVAGQLQRYIDDNQYSYKVTTDQINYFLRPGDHISLTKENWFTGYVTRIKQIDYAPGQMVLTCGKNITNYTKDFGKYLRGTVDDDSLPIQQTTMVSGAGSFTVKAADYAKGGWKCYFKLNFEIDDDTTVSDSALCEVAVNGKVTGRIRLDGSSSIEIDITDFCTVSTTADKTNTVKTTLYNATGWTYGDCAVNQYRRVAFVA
jgi:hypothetical protein